MDGYGHCSGCGVGSLRQGEMTHAVLALLLRWHIIVVPVFVPSVSGLRTAQEQVSYAPRWHHIFHTGKLEQPDGVMVFVKFDY